MANAKATGNRFSHMPGPHIEDIRQVSYNKKQTEYQYFPEEYFTGSDITIYFGDVWLDEITALEFTLHEPLKPIYGYASYTWDAIARGSRIVEGQFRIAFKEAGYLQVVLDHISQLGDKAKPRLAYLMDGEKTPDYLAGVKEDIEDALNRWHGNKDAKGKEPDKKVPEEFLDEFEWPALKHINLDKNMIDAKTPNLKKRKRQGSKNWKNKKYLGAISQLQDRLMELGYDWNSWKWTEGPNKGKDISFSVKSRPGGKISSKAIQKFKPKGNWRLCRRYDNNDNAYGGNASYDYRNLWEAEMQRRLGSYPGANAKLKNAMGGKHGTIDGRYGGSASGKSGTSAGLNIFQDLCLAPAGASTRAPGGSYLTEYVYNEMKKGFGVTGVFDTPTRIAVILFQEDHGLKADGIVGEKTRKALSPTGTKTKTIPGKVVSLYQPDKLFEPRASQYEKEVWGRKSSADEEHSRRTFFYYRTPAMQKYMQKNGFDIYINYGPYPEDVIKHKGQMASKLPQNKVNFNTTVKAIRNVQLMMTGQVLDVSGLPVEEVYSFYAKDLD